MKELLRDTNGQTIASSTFVATSIIKTSAMGSMHTLMFLLYFLKGSLSSFEVISLEPSIEISNRETITLKLAPVASVTTAVIVVVVTVEIMADNRTPL